MEKESFSLMEIYILVNFSRIKDKEQEICNTKMDNDMKVNGKETINKGEVLIAGRMEKNILDNGGKIILMGEVSFFIVMVINIKDSSKKE